MAALLLAEEGFHVLLCGAEFTQFDLRFLVAGVEPVFLRGKGLIFGIQLFEVRQCPELVGLEIGASGLVHSKLCTVLLLELGGIPHSLELLCKGLLYLCPLNSLHAEMIRRRMEAEIADIGQEAADETHLYKDALVIQTYQHIEKLCRNAPDRLKESLSSPKYIVADECHYLTDFSTYNINTYLSLEVLQRAEKDHVVIYMSATGGQVYEMLNAATETPPDRIYTLPQNNAHIARMYFYARDNLEMILHDIPADEKAVIFMSGGDDLVKMKELFGDAAGYYCSENNARYGKKLDSLEDCIKDRMLQKRFLFTTKAIGMGIEIKDRTLKQSISPYRMPVLVDWIKEHLNQPMKWKDLYTGIMISKVFAEYRNRPMKPTTLNKKLAIYGVQAVRGRDKKRVKDGKANENRDVLFWFLVEF